MTEWQYMCRPVRNGGKGWIAAAKRGFWVGDCVATEPGEVWFEFRATKNEAMFAIQNEVRRIMN